MLFRLAIVAFSSLFYVVKSAEWDSENSVLLRQALETFLQSATYPRCSSVDFQNEHEVCQIDDASDERYLACQGHESCIESQSSGMPLACPDGSVSKVCSRVSEGSKEYVCACLSAPRAFGSEGGDQFAWTSGWDPNLPINLEQGDVFYRHLCHQPSGHCVAEEKVHLQYLLVHLNIGEASMSASSYWASHQGFHFRRVILGSYTDAACAWVPGSHDTAPWIRFDMGREVTVWGVILKERCEYGPQRVTSFTLKSSYNSSTWITVAEDMSAIYPDGTTALCWLRQRAKGRHWHFFSLTWVGLPSMKADLIGET